MTTVTMWLDLRSPYSFLAVEPAYAMAAETGATLSVRPYHLAIESMVNPKDPAAVAQALRKMLRKIKYIYRDVRRFANRRGLTVLGPQKIYDPTWAHLALLKAIEAGVARVYLELAYTRFFKRELDYDDRAAVEAVLAEAGGPGDLAAFAEADGRKRLAALQAEAEAQGVFGVPSFVVDGELFWGHDRLDFIRDKLRAPAAAEG